MKLSEKILNTDFEEIKLGFVGGKAGYLAKEVDAHLQSIALDIEKIEKDYAKVLRQNEMHEAAKKTAADVKMDKVMSSEEVKAKEAELEQQASEISVMKESFETMLVVAQQEAMKIKEKAKAEAEQLYNDAQKDARLIIEKAREIERESEAKIQEQVEIARVEINNMAECYDEIKNKLSRVYRHIGEEVGRLEAEDKKVI